MWNVKCFESTTELQAWLRSSGLVMADIKEVYFDAASGKHIVVYFK